MMPFLVYQHTKRCSVGFCDLEGSLTLYSSRGKNLGGYCSIHADAAMDQAEREQPAWLRKYEQLPPRPEISG